MDVCVCVAVLTDVRVEDVVKDDVEVIWRVGVDVAVNEMVGIGVS
jgi:hypothetical protein